MREPFVKTPFRDRPATCLYHGRCRRELKESLPDANKKIKVYDEELKKARKEIETLSIVGATIHPLHFSKNEA
jgi:Cys-tRNA synthase (O-phospho-L-seryl-tRNA:Cys-tRNA synthase)